ncbi:MAG TPA: nitrite/sulfite reductase [Polyangiaceae bacterium]|jgi:sulfite reductase (ferredoxin)|nr:nitrite/sulfite reductase [Polyangiaceae bacterium]
MTAGVSWKDTLKGHIREDWAREIDIYETQIELRKKRKIEEKLFAETRLRRGVYGQRYDNGQRHDGTKTQELKFPCEDLTKGPSTVWDAPGMMRIKIPFGKMSAEQLEVLSDLAEEYSDQILHVTTRQDIQLHFIHIEDTPDLMRRLAAVGITTREACGNSVRNVTACPYAGVCSDESFDVTPYAHATAFFLLGHDDTQNFGRKFKIAFSGCKDHPCGLTSFHDGGAIAKKRTIDGKEVRGFEFFVGGGLGAVPYPAALLDEFLPEQELLPMMQAVCRVFGRLGEKENRSRARIKFLVKKLGVPEFKRLVLEERQLLRVDPRWTSFLEDLHAQDEKPLREGGPLPPGPRPDGFEAWYKSNVKPQAQAGYVTAAITLPLGDFTPQQGRAIAQVMRKYTGDSLRTTVSQNLMFRWISEADLPALYGELRAIGLAEAGADTISDITSCPGTDTCKLGISSSRGLAGELRKRLAVVGNELSESAPDLSIKCSGCYNSCGQHHIADLGFLGVSRNVGGRRVPHFQLVVGGERRGNAGSFGLALAAIPSKNVPGVVERMTRAYVAGKQDGETFKQWVDRFGKKEVKKLLDDLTKVPTYDQDPSYYSDWGDPREYTVDDMGEGECAGEVVPFIEFGLAASEREVFEAQVLLEEGQSQAAAKRAYSAMLQAARALAKQKNPNLGEDAGEIVGEFRTHYYDTKLFFDPFVGGKFAQFLFRTHEDGIKDGSSQAAHQLIEEAQLFVEAAHQCYARHGSALNA